MSQGLPAFRGDSQASTWIYRIATHVAIDRLRGGGTSPTGELPLRPEQDMPAGVSAREKNPVEQQAIRDEMNACIRQVIDGLPEAYRAVIVLSELEGFRNREIAEILDLSVDAVKIRLHRARARLKQALEGCCRFYTDDRDVLCCDRKAGDAHPSAPPRTQAPPE